MVKERQAQKGIVPGKFGGDFGGAIGDGGRRRFCIFWKVEKKNMERIKKLSMS